MIHYDHLKLSEEILTALAELNIDYVFQPIFESDGKTVYAWEALMRPKGITITDLIEEYDRRDKLHVIEVATFFGAMQAYILRGYKEKVSINSFPSESITDEEVETFLDYFSMDVRGKLVVELLEYPRFSLKHWQVKIETIKELNHKVAIDDFGTGINDMGIVNITKPDIIKIDRSLISNVDSDPDKQKNCKEIIEFMHKQKILIVAEGVETKEEFDCMKSLGADLFQGYYLARPE